MRQCSICGHVEGSILSAVTVECRHGHTFMCRGQDINGNFVNKNFDTVKPARAFLHARGEDEQINPKEM